MLQLLILILFWGQASAQPLEPSDRIVDQSHHTKILLFEGWRGAYLRSMTDRDRGVVRFDFCGFDETQRCRMLTEKEIPLSELPRIRSRLLQELRKIKEELERKRASGPLPGVQNYIAGIFGSERDERNIRALDQLIVSIQNEGLENMVLLTEADLSTGPGRRDPCEISSPVVADEVISALADVLSSPIRVPNPKGR